MGVLSLYPDTAIFERLNLILTSDSRATTGRLVVELAERTMPIWRNKRGFSGNDRQARSGIADKRGIRLTPRRSLTMA